MASPKWRYAGRRPGSVLAAIEQLLRPGDACLIGGRARVEKAAKRVAPVLKPGGWLFFHDWFARERYRDRLDEML